MDVKGYVRIPDWVWSEKLDPDARLKLAERSFDLEAMHKRALITLVVDVANMVFAVLNALFVGHGWHDRLGWVCVALLFSAFAMQNLSKARICKKA